MSAELDLAARVVEAVRAAAPGAEAEASVRHAEEALTRFANSAVHQNVLDATTTVRLRVHVDGRTAAGSTTATGADGLRALVADTLAAARACPPDAGWPGLAPPAVPAGTAARDEATAHAPPDERAERVRAFVAAAGGLTAAGYCRTTGVSAAVANSAGQAVTGATAEAALDGVARSGGADGVARLAAARLADLDGAVLGARAAAKARAAADPVELPPGRLPVVLEPEAVSDLLFNLAFWGFNGRYAAHGQSFAAPGTAQFDPAVTILDEPLGGPLGVADLPFDAEGTPRADRVLVDAGTTVGVAHDRRTAAEAGTASTGHATAAGRTFGPYPTHLRLAAGPDPGGDPGGAGGPVAPAARALVAGMERGLLVTDLWYTRVLDQRALVLTGLTRNGVWLVEDGAVTRAVGNLRFTEAYPRALAPGRVRGVGAATVLLPDRVPGTRYAAPALYLAGWNFTGNAAG